MKSNIRLLINTAVESELENLPNTVSQIEDPIQRLNFLTKLIPYVCSPIKQIESTSIELREDNLSFLDDYS